MDWTRGSQLERRYKKYTCYSHECPYKVITALKLIADTGLLTSAYAVVLIDINLIVPTWQSETWLRKTFVTNR
ncbi:hypothetical protein K450DRAFT_220040 [Umbelopsis ramanniana AG]|uniref:Uncharacterized protein n=1 Tax=Umbelopsis ramanniana AG TaxID=1314678 RepID=A0AAD5HGQ5_UMBRA|nr:uncharacterized protein K450DRAFT_220040 [Umbelopsis ramanniana AG]KAI8583802.1 hypothetical protein K450DRAFT_220040 [Umbelopsis ramanniana AG]